jgi:ParB family chromosome partitioning protein
MTYKRAKGLGRGLEALLGGDMPDSPPPPEVEPAPVAPAGPPNELPLASLRPGRYQPRTRMDETSLAELADSIREHGMMQPIVVRAAGDDRYELIAGERRFRAAALAQLERVPVIVRDVSDENALAMALIENIQREDLNPLEEANAIKRLLDEFGYTHEQAAQAIGRSRSTTSNLLRLLNLADPVQTMLLAGDLEMGHARALLPLDRADQILLAHQVVQKRLSVRETEKLVTRHQAGPSPAAPGNGNGTVTRVDRDRVRLEERLADNLGARVELLTKPSGKGKLVIHFSNPDGFAGLIERLNLGVVLDDRAD